jgi:hypothetical protein
MGRAIVPKRAAARPSFEPRRHFWTSGRIDAEGRPLTLLAVALLIDIVLTVSAVMFTSDPTTGPLDRMVTDSVFGQSEAIVRCRVEPDTCILDKVGAAFGPPGQQKFKIVRGPDMADVERAGGRGPLRPNPRAWRRLQDACQRGWESLPLPTNRASSQMAKS